MYEKDIRAAQLEDLKSGIFSGMFVVEELNSSFLVRQKWEFEKKEDAERKYSELANSGIYTAFLRKYAKFDF